MEIKNETIDKIMNYLATKPWREVEPLIHELTGQFPVTPAKFEPAVKMPESKIPGKKNEKSRS